MLIVCLVVYTVCRCDMYSTSRHNTCVSESSVSGGSRGRGRALVWRLVTYSVQALTPKRPIDFLLSRLDASVAGLQGTRLAPRTEPATYPARQQTTWAQRAGAYHVVHWTRPTGSSSGDPRGVSIAWLHRLVPRKFAHWEILRKVWQAE